MPLDRSGSGFISSLLRRSLAVAPGILGVVAAIGILPPLVAAPPAYLTDVKAWRGHFTARANVTLDDLPAEVRASTKGELSIHVRVSAEVILDQYDTHPSEWKGRIVSSSITSTYSSHLVGKGVTIDCNYSASGPFFLESHHAPPRLTFHEGAGWELNLYGARVKNTITTVTKFASGATHTDSQNSVAFAASGTDGDFPYPTSGFILRGRGVSTKLMATSGTVTLSPELVYDVEIYLEPTDTTELKLVIDPPAGYDTWRPTAKGRQLPGEPLKVTARVETADGSKPQARVESFVWKLVDTSREPGAVLNYPVDADDSAYDLKLDAEGGYFSLSEGGQQLERAIEQGHSDSVTVDPYDWGAWSTLEVTAKLTDGRELKGKLKGESDFGLRLPKRAATSKIADSWKKDTGASGGDETDDEEKPLGDKNQGDGFTLYEEYRGFYVGGKHVGGNPKKKDFFVYLEPEASEGLGGVLLFRRLTGLNVHHKLEEAEFAPSRVMNANRKEGPHRVDQHGVVLKKMPGQEGYAYAHGTGKNPSTPRGIIAVELPVSWGKHDESFVDSTIAHELGHATNLWHHGDGEGEVGWRVQDGQLLENGRPVRVFTEGLVDITAQTTQAVAASIKAGQFAIMLPMGTKLGQSSGADTCIMRYDNSLVYKHPTEPDVRIAFFREPTGTQLCASGVGTGVNDADRDPFPRYGNAKANRGDCLHQILVNDAIPAPVR